MSQKENKKSRKKLWLWILSIIFIVGGMSTLSDSFFAGVFAFVAGAIICPPIINIIKEKSEGKAKTWIFVTAFIVLVSFSGMALPNSENFQKDISLPSTINIISDVNLTIPENTKEAISKTEVYRYWSNNINDGQKKLTLLHYNKERYGKFLEYLDSQNLKEDFKRLCGNELVPKDMLVSNERGLFLHIGLDDGFAVCDFVSEEITSEFENQENTTQKQAQQKCIPNWKCGKWTICSNEVQTRICTDKNDCGTIEEKPIETQNCKDYDLEMSIDELLNEFSGLTKLQQEEKIKELKGKRIKTSTTAYKIDKASLSTQYVVMDDDYLYPSVKAFFPAEEKDKLLKVNIGDKITFIGEFVTYKQGTYVPSYVEFTKSKLVG